MCVGVGVCVCECLCVRSCACICVCVCVGGDLTHTHTKRERERERKRERERSERGVGAPAWLSLPHLVHFVGCSRVREDVWSNNKLRHFPLTLSEGFHSWMFAGIMVSSKLSL